MERLTQQIKKYKKRGLANYLENLLNGILNIFHMSGRRAENWILIPGMNYLFLDTKRGALSGVVQYNIRLLERDDEEKCWLENITYP